MWFANVDIPEEVVAAHRDGKLVLFVGAGASMGPPSSLPDFASLAKRIALQSNFHLTEDEILRPDLALGRMKLDGIDVHVRVADLVSDSSSKPNRLQTAIIDLALAAPVLRIVTTNYDRHLTAVLEDRGAVFEEFAASALPVGDDFEGLIHLHGGLHQDPSRLVVTDADFGRAYLVDAWAARFLERMFHSFTVLFVGYSHADMVMTYFARALGPRSARFALTDETHEDQRWHQLGITPVRYDVVNDSHKALDESVERWASVVATGLGGHRERIAKLVSNPPSTVPEDVSYLESCLQDLPRTQLFAELADGVEWLEWVAVRAPFNQLFKVAVPSDDCARTLAHWFAWKFVIVEDQSPAAMGVIERNGGVFGPLVWHEIALRARSLDNPRPRWFSPWLVLLATNPPAWGSEQLTLILRGCSFPDDEAIALVLFDYLTEPTAVMTPSFGTGRTRFIAEIRGDHYWLSECWQSVLLPNLQSIASKVAPIVDRNLRRARQLLVNGGTTFDTWSFGRSAIEPHEQDNVPQAFDVLIDAARDCLEMLLENEDPMGPALLDSWANSGAPILERLAVHGWCHRTDVGADIKIATLTDRGWAFEDHLRHEAFRLVANELAKASTPVADDFIASVEAWSTPNE